MYIVDSIGRWFIYFFTELGSASLFLAESVKALFTTRLRFAQLFNEMKRIGVDSSSIIVISSLSSGFALALQTHAGLSRIGGEEMLGVVVAWSMTRELGPVLTAIMVCGHSGSSIAAELGTMRIGEQIDALKTLCINPLQYLIVPRILAGGFIMPFVTLFAMFFGILGGYLFTITSLQSNPELYMMNIRDRLVVGDIFSGLIKSSVFGFILAFVGSYKGYRTEGGAKGVGTATTGAVVLGCILILVANYFLSVMLLKVGL